MTQDDEKQQEMKDAVTVYTIAANLAGYFCKVCPVNSGGLPDFRVCYIAKNAIESSVSMAGVAAEKVVNTLSPDSPVYMKITDGQKKITVKKDKCYECFIKHGLDEERKRLNLE